MRIMSAEQNTDLIRKTWTDVIAGNADAAAANMSDEVSWMIAGNLPGVSGTKKGKAAFLDFALSFIKTIIPMPVVHYFLTILPYLEFAIGALLIVGLFTMEACIAGALIMIILIFGMGARQEWGSVGNEMIYAAWYFLLIAFNENNWLCIDNLRKKPS